MNEDNHKPSIGKINDTRLINLLINTDIIPARLQYVLNESSETLARIEPLEISNGCLIEVGNERKKLLDSNEVAEPRERLLAEVASFLPALDSLVTNLLNTNNEVREALAKVEGLTL